MLIFLLFCLSCRPTAHQIEPPLQRVLRVDWESGKVTFTTKDKILTALGFLHDEPEHVWLKFPITKLAFFDNLVMQWLVFIIQVKANIRLVVASCIAGTDYNTNYPGKSFGKSREATALAPAMLR